MAALFVVFDHLGYYVLQHARTVVFRLYPLYVFGLVVAVLLWKLGLGSIGKTNYDGETSLLTHALMLSNVLGTKNAINVIWTLSYEMAFYLLLTALFVTGVHKRSGRYAMLFAVAAVALGGVLPMTALSRSFLGTRLIAEIADLLILAGVALAVSRYHLPKVVGAVLAGGTAMALVRPRFNPPPPSAAGQPPRPRRVRRSIAPGRRSIVPARRETGGPVGR